MAQIGPSGRGELSRDLRKNPRLISKQLARRRPERLARLPQSRLGLSFFLFLFATLVVAGLLVFFGAAFSVYADYTSDLPPVGQLSSKLSFKTTQILDRNGRLLYEVYDKDGGKRTPVSLGDISPSLIDAAIATEDKDFYVNPGFDPVGIGRAVWQNLFEGQIVSGASTITQQLAKNVLLGEEERTEKSYTRKLREAVLAFRVSQQYPKDQILEMYLNEVYYGHLSYGIEAAAQTYFGRHAGDLTLAESAMLAGLPQAPSQYDPLINPDAAKERQAHVLNRMVNQGYITPAQAETAQAEPLHFQVQRDMPIQAPHFVMYVRQLLEQEYGSDTLYRGGLKVTTTLDLDWNRIAENAIRDQLQYLKKQEANNAALVAVNPGTGEILTMVGSKDYYDGSIDGQVNVALSRRQPGSTIKPIVYVTALSKGWGPETIIVDEPTAFPNAPGQPLYVPHNFDFKFDGPMTIRHALSNSKNIPAVKALMFAGIPDFLKMADNLGVHLENANVYGLSLGLGAGEVRLLDMVGAYAALDNYGSFVPPVAILRIEDWQGNVLKQYEPIEGRQVVSPTQAYMITSILSDNWARTPLQGPNSPLRLSRPAAAKTGSTDDYKDSWTIGYTPDLTTGVWVGNTDSKPMKEVLGSLGAGRIWHQFMEDVHAATPPIDFVPPPGITEYRLCLETGRPATASCNQVLTEVYPNHDYAKIAVIPGLPLTGAPAFSAPIRQGKPLGQTVSQGGAPLQSTPTPIPGAPTPTPEPTAAATPSSAVASPTTGAAPAPAQPTLGPTPGNVPGTSSPVPTDPSAVRPEAPVSPQETRR